MGTPARVLEDLVNTLDPKLVAAALGLDPQAPLIYLADRIHPWPEDSPSGSGAMTSELMKTDTGS